MNIYLLSTEFWKDENIEKEAGYGLFKKMCHLWPIFGWFFVSSNKQTHLQQTNVKNDPLSIQCLDSNSQRFGHESPGITPGQELQPRLSSFYQYRSSGLFWHLFQNVKFTNKCKAVWLTSCVQKLFQCILQKFSLLSYLPTYLGLILTIVVYEDFCELLTIRQYQTWILVVSSWSFKIIAKI